MVSFFVIFVFFAVKSTGRFGGHRLGTKTSNIQHRTPNIQSQGEREQPRQLWE